MPGRKAIYLAPPPQGRRNRLPESNATFLVAKYAAYCTRTEIRLLEPHCANQLILGTSDRANCSLVLWRCHCDAHLQGGAHTRTLAPLSPGPGRGQAAAAMRAAAAPLGGGTNAQGAVGGLLSSLGGPASVRLAPPSPPPTTKLSSARTTQPFIHALPSGTGSGRNPELPPPTQPRGSVALPRTARGTMLVGKSVWLPKSEVGPAGKVVVVGYDSCSCRPYHVVDHQEAGGRRHRYLPDTAFGGGARLLQREAGDRGLGVLHLANALTTTANIAPDRGGPRGRKRKLGRSRPFLGPAYRPLLQYFLAFDLREVTLPGSCRWPG